ncbi:MAG: hypothetical protein HQK54_05735 [Oligoflexales bacterium]|nr:hypothetical protein [Oligoflexales bacterium]
MSHGLYGSDYAYANAGLKFKTLPHGLFGVPRGDFNDGLWHIHGKARVPCWMIGEGGAILKEGLRIL